VYKPEEEELYNQVVENLIETGTEAPLPVAEPKVEEAPAPEPKVEEAPAPEPEEEEEEEEEPEVEEAPAPEPKVEEEQDMEQRRRELYTIKGQPTVNPKVVPLIPRTEESFPFTLKGHKDSQYIVLLERKSGAGFIYDIRSDQPFTAMGIPSKFKPASQKHVVSSKKLNFKGSTAVLIIPSTDEQSFTTKTKD